MALDSTSRVSPRALPGGVVTFLFSDIEGSTRLLHWLGDDYADVLQAHHRLMRACFAAHEGVEVDSEGDAFLAAFSSPHNAVAAAVDAQRALYRHAWPHGETLRVRMGLHTGEPLLVDDKYIGIDVHRASRICTAAHGGQVVVSARLLELVGDRLPAGVRPRDLGLHRLKDLAEPEHLFQLNVEGLPSAFPALRSLAPPTNVPHDVTALVGRHQARADLRDTLGGPGARLSTVTGPGGVGKTRLAAAVGLEVREQFPFGVYFVDLTNVHRATDVLPAIAEVLQIAREGDQGVGDALVTHIDAHPMLLILDNFEQVLGGALELSRLLTSCPDLHVLVTSRMPLNLDREREYQLPPLSLPRGPTLDDIRESDAVQLFVDRARKARRDFRLTVTNAAAVAEICILLDGLPLAIELAAARSKLFGPDALLSRLGDRLKILTGGARDIPVRHRSLRGAIEWSYDLLDREERQFFLDLAVFDGGARLDTIEAVVGAAHDAVKLVSALLNHSLLTQSEDDDGQPRLTMLQTVRDYAQELVSQQPERLRTLREAHANHFLQMAEMFATSDFSTDRKHLERDLDNVRAALAYWLEDETMDRDRSIKALRLATKLSEYSFRHGLSPESGANWLERALAHAVDPPAELKAPALRILGVMNDVDQQFDQARRLLAEALQLYIDMGDRHGEAHTLNSLGVVAVNAGDLDRAEGLLQQALAMRREIGDGEGVSFSLSNLGLVRLDRGDPQGSGKFFGEALSLAKARRDDWAVAVCSGNLGVAKLMDGDYAESRRLLQDAFRTFLEVDDTDYLLETMEGVAALTAALGRWTAAARLGGACEASRRALHLPGSPGDRAHLDRSLGEVRTVLGEAAFENAWREGGAMTHEQARDYAREALKLAEECPSRDPSVRR